MVAALYRRYRPEAFAEMIGQSQVTEPLMTALRTGRIGHAYLFSGPRGCGKTTSARILARCLNCAEGPTDTPCGTCPSCVELSRDGGGSLDVVEIDAASHGGVDDARDLRERAVFAPARDRFKIFIIDEAHMVTPGGFNALLKIVEEPPPHVKFVFATTEPEKVIGTIRSRTHHYPFRLIAPGILIDYVHSLCDSEGVQVEPGVLPLVVRAGGGSVRDTLSILDQLIAGSEDGTVTAERAAGLLGFTGSELLDDVVAALGAHDPAAAFRATDRVVQTGQDPRRFVEDLLERLRDLIVVSATTVDGAAAVFRGVPQDQLTRMFEQSRAFGPGELSRIADTVSAALDKMAGATAPRLQLELMVARALVHAEQAPAGRPAAAPPSRPASPALQSGQTLQGGSRGPAQAPSAEQAPRPAQETPRENPLSALAAARGAAMGQPAAQPQQSGAQAQAVPREAPAEPKAEPSAAPRTAPTDAPSTASGDAPNAAETAAHIREFLREDAAGAARDETSEQRPAPQAAKPAEQPPRSETPHPNAGAASFGRPISDVLSTAQIESIGSDPQMQLRPEPAERSAAADASSAASNGAAAEQPSQGGADGAAEAGAEGAGASSVPEADAGAGAAAGSSAGEGPDADADPSSEQPGFEDLAEIWSELLDEILESDRDAWNAVKSVQPLALDGDVLTVGLLSRSDLDSFKEVGAAPLREAILSAVGITVKYKPKPLPREAVQPAGQPAGGPRETGGQAARVPDPDAEEPHRGASGDRGPTADSPSADDDPVARAAARLSALGPALAAPAWADPQPQAAAEAAPQHSGAVEERGGEDPTGDRPSAAEPVPAAEADRTGSDRAPLAGANAPGAAAPAAERRSDDGYGDDYPGAGFEDDDPYAGQSEDPYLARSSAPGPSPAPTPAPAAVPDPEPVAPSAARPDDPAPATPAPPTDSAESDAADARATPAAEPARKSGPAFTRYGEAVVREVLSAKFVEELPLPSRREV